MAVLCAAVLFCTIVFSCRPAADNRARSGAERVVSLVPALTEIAFAVGAGDRVVGVSNYCDYPPAVAGLPKVGSFVAPVAEQVLALRPDLVLTSPSPGNENPVRAMERTGIRVVVVDNESNIEAARRAVLQVAGLLGAPERGRALVERMDAQFAEAAASGRRNGSGPALEPAPAVAIVVGREPLVLAGPHSYLGELIGVVGGRNIAAPAGGRWPRISLEQLLAAAPAVLIDLSMGSETPETEERLRAYWSRYAATPAVASGRVFAAQPNVFLRPGPRLGAAALSLAQMIHGRSAGAVGAQ